jgi:metallophosphoesterase (TIGR00282 family)
MKLLFIGDIVGKGGRNAVRALAPALRAEYGCSFCIANGENMAGGGGMTQKCLTEMQGSGVDVFTGGDHIWDQREFVRDIENACNVLRPANVYPGQPGRGFGLFPLRDGGVVGVISLLGRVFMQQVCDCPFQAAERVLAEMVGKTDHIVVDFHAEATSEVIAMGRFLDGSVTAVLGTHTHVPTADEMILPGGTALQCDVGMVGARESVLGRAIEPVVQRFSTGMPARFTVVEKGIRLHATVVTADERGRATGIERIVRDFEPQDSAMR